MNNGHSEDEEIHLGDSLREFIDNLESGDADRRYVEDLIERYGLSHHEFAKEILVAMRKEIMSMEKVIPEPLFSYLKVFLHDIMVNSEDRVTATYFAFLCGIAFESVVEIEED